MNEFRQKTHYKEITSPIKNNLWSSLFAIEGCY
jgi:hypothetical protein